MKITNHSFLKIIYLLTVFICDLAINSCTSNSTVQRSKTNINKDWRYLENDSEKYLL
ncbi:hypothetical protein MKD41_01455 [Lutibacter sp. A64]|uniref:hypothetical protein n=1 Tax=Lutibacter sp. A64 TaxID=2918526 RepID=UPI001F065F5C|nr:hypothetical protein [Lutibacter sp. A64]UMB54157.1 hypothetical protein MKD41_01455 [Lutibacter sp. A64]